MSLQNLNCLQLKTIYMPKWHSLGKPVLNSFGSMWDTFKGRQHQIKPDLSDLLLWHMLRWGRCLVPSLGIRCAQAHYQHGVKPVVTKTASALIGRTGPLTLVSLGLPPDCNFPKFGALFPQQPLGQEPAKQCLGTFTRSALSPRATKKQAKPFAHAP